MNVVIFVLGMMAGTMVGVLLMSLLNLAGQDPE
jgi:hypothetical protein